MGGSVFRVVLWASVALGCGDETTIGQSRSTDPGAGGRSTGGARSSGGAASAGGSAAGGGGSVGGGGPASGGTESTGGSDNTGGRIIKPLPEGPPWDPPFPVGAPGWRDSKERFCPHRYGPTAGPQVWSDAGAVFALHNPGRCPLDPRSPCGGQGMSLYANEGSGWVLLLDEEDDEGHARLRGFPGGPLAFYAQDDCGLRIVDRGGTLSRCIWSKPDIVYDHLFSVSIAPAGEAYALTSSGKVLTFDAEGWSELASLDPAPQPPANLYTDVFASSIGPFVAGRGGRIAQVWQNGEVSTSNLGLADHVAAWQFNLDDAWLATSDGTLKHFAGSEWVGLEFPEFLEVRGLWGSPEGTLYFHTAKVFGRARDDKVEILVDLGSDPARFSSLWGNSDTEVFLGIDHGGLDQYECSGAFVAWFDGKQMHLF